MAFEYNNYPLIYSAAPLQPYDPVRNSGRLIGDAGPPFFNMVICSTKPKVSDNKCFFFSNFGMYAAEEQGLQPFLAESFTIGHFNVA